MRITTPLEAFSPRRDPLFDRYMGVTHVHGGVEAVESIHEAVAKGYACRQRFN